MLHYGPNAFYIDLLQGNQTDILLEKNYIGMKGIMHGSDYTQCLLGYLKDRKLHKMKIKMFPESQRGKYYFLNEFLFVKNFPQTRIEYCSLKAALSLISSTNLIKNVLLYSFLS